MFVRSSFLLTIFFVFIVIVVTNELNESANVSTAKAGEKLFVKCEEMKLMVANADDTTSITT